SGELAAEYVDEGRLAARVIALQHIFARRVLRLGRPVIIEGTHAGISPYDIGRGDGLAEIFARARAQIVDFRRRDPHVGGIAAIVEIRRTDQGEVGLVRYREKDAAVAVLEEIGPIVLELAADNDVTALHEANVVRIVAAKRAGEDFIHPGTSRIDQEPRRDDLALSRWQVLERHTPQLVAALGRHGLAAGADLCAEIGRRPGIQDDEPGIVDRAVRIFERLHIIRL